VGYAVASQVLRPARSRYMGIEADELLETFGLLGRSRPSSAGVPHAAGPRCRLTRSADRTSRGDAVAIDEWALRFAPSLRLKHTAFPRGGGKRAGGFWFQPSETGGALLRHWDFPASMSEPVRWQYTPRASAGQSKMASLLVAEMAAVGRVRRAGRQGAAIAGCGPFATARWARWLSRAW